VIRAALAAAVMVTLPLATGPHEVAMALALGVAVLGGERRAMLGHPWATPALILAAFLVIGPLPGGNWREGIGHAWLLAPLLALPGLGPDRWATKAGLAAAGVASAWSIVQFVAGGEGTGGFGHHLTLAYALLPALGVALARRSWALVALLAGGALATRSEGVLVALPTVVLAVLSRRPLPALAVGVTATVLALPLGGEDQLARRALLWTGGLELAGRQGVGIGSFTPAAGLIWDQLRPGFWFPYHAHDSAIQILAELGPGGIVAFVAMCGAVLAGGAVGPAAGLAGVLVGALTQDTLGDLEVARAAWAWVALGGLRPGQPELTSAQQRKPIS
jgi:hypothetical protein